MTAPEHSSLPLRDHDHLPTSANRLAVVQMIQARLAELEPARPKADRQSR
ncbi:MAG: hypothetical protein JO132_06680 [Streptosporangiaceae bacterium]|nr:hypothetical protein [Streptosporangiaceae bacterium]